MKQVIIIIRPEKYFEMKQALIDAHFFQMTSINVFGRGKESVAYTYYDEDATADDKPHNYLVLKKRIDIYIRAEDEARLIETVLKVNKQGKQGDGKIFVIPLEAVKRIHTGELDENALV